MFDTLKLGHIPVIFFSHVYFLVAAAEITSGPESQPPSPVVNGSNVVLRCSFDGIPSPNITWLVDGNVIDVDINSRLVAIAENNSAELRFSPVTQSGGGSYQCSAVNIFGNASGQSSIDIVILGES